MKKSPSAASKRAKHAKSKKANAAKAVLAAASMLVLPMSMAPRLAAAQSGARPTVSPTNPGSPNLVIKQWDDHQFHPIKISGTYTVLGEGEGHTIFKGADGKAFYLDPGTGDKRSVAFDYFLKIGDIKGENRAYLKYKDESPVSILGADAKGNTVMKNARGEAFTLDPKTGNMVFVKWPK